MTRRIRSRSDIDAALAAFVATGTAEDIATAIAEAGGIAAPVITHVGLMTSPQIAAREWLQTVTHRFAGTQTLAGFLWGVDPDAPSWDLPCGLVGEHNVEVLGELGYKPREVDALFAAGAIGDRYGA